MNKKDNKNYLEKLGLKIGHYTNIDALTGATCFIIENGADIGIDIRGSDTGSINIPAYEPKSASKLVQGIVLTGGSTFGLEASIGVMDYLHSPNVVGAVIYDRAVGKDERPHIQDGYDMAKSANYTNIMQGNIGVGTGATTGKWEYGRHIKGGFGLSIEEVDTNTYIGAFVVTNSIGDIINKETNQFYSECGKYPNNYIIKQNIELGTNTTLAVIATNIEMSKNELIKVSELAHDGMARAIYPVHTNYDGDVIFSISPHSNNRVKSNLERTDLVNFVGIYASNLLIEAINNSVKNATSIDNFPAYTTLFNK